MAFFAGLMANQAGYGAGKNQAYQDALQLAAQQQQQEEQQREFNAQLKLQQQQMGIDPATGQMAKPVIPKQYSQLRPNNKGKLDTPIGPEDYVNHYLGLAAANVANPAFSQAFANIAQQYGLGAERAASADYTREGRLPLAKAQAGLADAHARYILDIQPKQFKERLGEDRDKYLAQISARQELAQYNAGERMQIAAITAYYRMQGQTQENAFRAAVDEYNQSQQNYRSDVRSALNPLSPEYGTTPQAPGAPAWPYTNPTTVNVNVNDARRAINADKTPTNSATPTKSQVGDATFKTFVSTLAAVAPQQAAAEVQQLVQSGAISKEYGDAALRALHGAAQPSAAAQPRARGAPRLPAFQTLDQALGTGGSQAPIPFH